VGGEPSPTDHALWTLGRCRFQAVSLKISVVMDRKSGMDEA
jgi:hypothetical protein